MTATAPVQPSGITEFTPKTNGHPILEAISLGYLRESPMNTRKHFDTVKLEELRKSIEKSGILTPLLVRPNPKLSTLKRGEAGPKLYEIAAGHRRFRAAGLAGAPTAPCIIREMDDATFLEILTIENLQREDVHPLEEAQGYKNLLTLEGYDIKKIADRVGKSESYVYDRMKLLQLTKEGQKLFLENRFSAGHAILLARLSKKDQDKCLQLDDDDHATAGGMWESEGNGHPALGLQDPSGVEGPYEGRLKPVSVRQLQYWIDKYVRFDERADIVPQLFPETAKAVDDVKFMNLKSIKITRDYQVHPDAKDPDGKRTYGPTSWTRADGNPEPNQFGETKPSKTCEYSVLGIVAVGEGRGESFQVCIDKKRCTVHYKEEIQERNRREREKDKGDSKTGPKASTKSEEPSWQREERLRTQRVKAAKDRWEKGGDAVLRAIAPLVKKLPVDGSSHTVKYLFEVIESGIYGLGDDGKAAAKLGVPRGVSPADVLRHLVMVALVSVGEPDYQGSNEKELQEELDKLRIKVDVVKLLDAANPEPKAEKPAAKKPAKKKAGKK